MNNVSVNDLRRVALQHAVHSHSWWKLKHWLRCCLHWLKQLYLLWTWKAIHLSYFKKCLLELWMEFCKQMGVLKHNISPHHLIPNSVFMGEGETWRKTTVIYKCRILPDNIKMISLKVEMALILNSISIGRADWLDFRVLSRRGEGWEQCRWVLFRVADPEATAPQPGENVYVSEDSSLEIEMAHDYRCGCKLCPIIIFSCQKRWSTEETKAERLWKFSLG